ncbi:histone acetyltransferase HPA2 [Vibrio sp. JCM 19236]|nr:histone acetyltransferase HPA2 [Vibrio sp. JCM 19236]
MKIRLLHPSEAEIQKELLFTALWKPEDETPHTKADLELPHIKEYYQNWGKQGDLALVAVNGDDAPIGLIQIRHKTSVTKDHAEHPELAMAVFPEYHGKGIAKALFNELFTRIENTESGIRLGVHPKNQKAIGLYERFGFRVYDTPDKGYPQMVWLAETL